MATETEIVPDKISSYLHIPKYNGLYSGLMYHKVAGTGHS